LPMSAVSQVSSFQFPVSSEDPQGLKPAVFWQEAARLKSCPSTAFSPSSAFSPALRSTRGGALPQRSVELPPVMPASRLEDRPAAVTVRSGIEELDALTGGLPRGGLSE